MLLVGKGSSNDPIEGCASVHNSMRLRSTSKLDPSDLQAAIDRSGATIDAITDRDNMLLRAQVPSKRLEECLKLLVELYVFPSFSASELKKEKTSQTLEYQRIRQDPMTASMTNVWEVAFPKSPLGHPVTGYPETIRKISPKTLRAFDEQTRRSAPLALALVGPQKEEALIDIASSCLEGIAIEPTLERIGPNPTREFNVAKMQVRSQQTTLTVGAVTLGASSSDYPGLLLLEDRLGSERHWAGTLFRELRDKRGLTYFPGSRVFALKELGLLTVYAGVKHEKVSDALLVALECMTELRDKTVPETDLKEIKGFHLRVIETMLEVPSRAATWLALSLLRGTETDPESYASRIEAVAPQDIRKIAEETFTPSRISLSVAGKPPTKTSLRQTLEEAIL